MPYHWILFDLDNTLYDFDASSRFALQKTFEAYQIDHTQENIRTYQDINHQCWVDFENGNLDFEGIRNIRFELFSKAINRDLDAKKMATTYLHLLSTVDYKIPGAMDLLNDLKSKYNLVVVTNGLQEVKRPQLSKPEIAHYFKAIVISEEIGVSKPHQGFFDYTFDAIGHPDKSEVIIIGDSLNSDIRGGENFGIDTCWFNPKGKPNDSMIQPVFEISKLEEFLGVLEKR